MAFDWLKHAFAIEKEGTIAPTPAQQAVIDRLCTQVVARGMTTPALVFLESVRPLNYLSSQILQFFTPILSVVADRRACDDLAEFLEHRGSVEYVCRRIEEIEREQAEKVSKSD
ncbi:MAG: hypothetical protein HY290_23900 [Planctomycetia bacterium]|nr:hypothetical protein [Planctomycetia bacterium]